MNATAAGDGALEHRARVRFHQADPAGVLFFGRVFELVSDAFEELIRSAGIAFDAVDSLRGFTTPIVHAEADYREPLRVGDDVMVRLQLSRIGKSSLAYRFDIRGPAGESRVTGQIVHVYVATEGFATRPLPADLRAALLGLADRLGMPPVEA